MVVPRRPVPTVNSLDRFDRIVASLHEATLDDTQWPETSMLIEEACGISGTDLVIAGGQGQEEAVWAMDWSFRHGGDLEHPKPRRTQIDSPEVRRPTAGAQSPHGVGHDPMGGPTICESDQLDLIRRLSPHIRHFIRIRAALAGARALSAAFEELLDHDLAGVLCVERRGRVVHANSFARSLLQRRDSLLQDRNGYLHARLPEEDARLRRLLAAAWTSPIATAVGSMTVRRSSHLPPVTLRVTPVVACGVGNRSKPVATSVLIVDPAAKPRTDLKHVAAALGLTLAESEVAIAVAKGATAREIAVATKRREATVRELLKRVHVKLGISRRADLVRAVLSVGAFPRQPADRRGCT